MVEEGIYSNIGTYWEKGNINEIDIVAINDIEKSAIIAKVKRKKENINLESVKSKAKNLLTGLPNYHVEFLDLSVEDM